MEALGSVTVIIALYVPAARAAESKVTVIVSDIPGSSTPLEGEQESQPSLSDTVYLKGPGLPNVALSLVIVNVRESASLQFIVRAAVSVTGFNKITGFLEKIALTDLLLSIVTLTGVEIPVASPVHSSKNQAPSVSVAVRVTTVPVV